MAERYHMYPKIRKCYLDGNYIMFTAALVSLCGLKKRHTSKGYILLLDDKYGSMDMVYHIARDDVEETKQEKKQPIIPDGLPQACRLVPADRAGPCRRSCRLTNGTCRSPFLTVRWACQIRPEDDHREPKGVYDY